MKPSIETEADLFYSALTHEPGSGRTQFLDVMCRDDVHKRQRLEALLNAHEQSGDLLDTIDAVPRPAVDSMDDLTDSNIGAYKLLQRIGEGGMGVVYLAEQQHPVRRRVALKIIKPGMDTREVIARFEAERQALALMDHAHVARVLDAGSTDAGRPFFAMELVQGVRITTFVATENLAVVDRLKLFVAVCRAIQHAHLKGIIHRDIKPSNVLVTQQDGTSIPKVIDFGIAKAINQSLTDKTLHTAHSHLVGTPSYMSPEQADGGGHDVDTRTDVYSLGVLLYELLTGEMPFDTAALKAAGPEGIRQIIRDSQPLRPSVRVGTSPTGETTTHTDAAAGNVRRQQNYLTGDLDWIVMKAIEKNRDRRYDSAAAFADDILRFLDGEAVLARPPSALYRLQKVSARYRGVIFTTLLILVALSAGLAVALVQRNKAIASQQLAEDRLRDMQAAQLKTETLLYAADIRLAARAVEDGDVAQAAELLERLRPATASRPDLRGREWPYLYHKVAGATASYPVCEAELYAVCPCPDRSHVVAAGADGQLYVLSPHTLMLERSVNSEQVQVNGMSFSGDGRVLCTAGDDGTIRLWSWPELAPLQRISFEADAETYAAILSNDGQFVIVCGQSPEVRIYSQATGAQTGRLAGHDRAVEAIALSPDGRTLACVASDRRLSVWDWRNEQQVYLSPLRDKRLSSVAFSTDGRLIADGSIGGEVHVTSVGDWQETADLQLTDGIQGMVMSPFREQLCVATRAGDIIAYAAGLTQSQTLPESDPPLPASEGTHAHDGRIYDVEYMGDGIVISVGQDGRVCRTRLNDAASDSDTRVIPELRSRTATLSPDGRLIVSCIDNALYAYDVRTSELQQLHQFPDDVHWTAIAITPDGQLLAAADAEGQIAIAPLENDSAAEIHHLPGTPHVDRLRFSRHGNRLTIVSLPHDRVVVTEFPSLQEVCRRSVVDNNNAVLSADGGLLAYNDAHDLVVVDVATGHTLVRSEDHHSETISDLAFSADDHSIVSIGNDRSIHVWNWADRSAPELLGVHSGGRPASFAITSDQQTLLTCSRAGEVVVWSIPARQELFTLTRTDGSYISMFLSDNDRTLITVDTAGQIAWLDFAPPVPHAGIRP